MTPTTGSQDDKNRTKWRKRPQFTIGDLLLAVAGVSAVLSAYFGHSALAASAIVLALGVAITILGVRRKDPFRGCLGLMLIVPAFWACIIFFVASFLLGIGPLYSQSVWPSGLTQMVALAETESGDVQAQGLGGFLDSEYAWSLSLPPDKLGTILAEFDLAPVAEPNVTTNFWQAFPRRWRPEKKPGNRYFSTPQFSQTSRGQDGEHYFVMYDPESERLYVWYKSNF